MPEIEIARLQLRHFTLDDFNDLLINEVSVSKNKRTNSKLVYANISKYWQECDFRISAVMMNLIAECGYTN